MVSPYNLYLLLIVPIATLFILIIIPQEKSLINFKLTSVRNNYDIRTIVTNLNSSDGRLITTFTVGTALSFFHTLLLYLLFNGQNTNYQFITAMSSQLTNMSALHINFLESCSMLAIDGVSIAFIVLTPLITFLSAALTHHLPTTFEERKIYYACLISIELFLLLAFTTVNLIVFYFAFEAVLLPIFLMIGR